MRKIVISSLSLLLILVGVYFSPLNMDSSLDWEANIFEPVANTVTEPPKVTIIIYTSRQCKACYDSMIDDIFSPFFGKIGYPISRAVDDPDNKNDELLVKKDLPALKRAALSQIGTDRLIRYSETWSLDNLPPLPYVVIYVDDVPVVGLPVPEANSQEFLDLKTWCREKLPQFRDVNSLAFAKYSEDLSSLPGVWRLKKRPSTYRWGSKAGMGPVMYVSLAGMLWGDWSTNIAPHFFYKQVPFFQWDWVVVNAAMCPQPLETREYAGFLVSVCLPHVALSETPDIFQGVPSIQVPYTSGEAVQAGFMGYLIYPPDEDRLLVRGPDPKDASQIYLRLVRFHRWGSDVPVWLPLVRVAVPAKGGLAFGAVPLDDMEYVGKYVGTAPEDSSAPPGFPDQVQIVFPPKKGDEN